MLVEIAICTWNRAALLDQTLSSLSLLKVPSNIDWQILLVDNHSTDSTQDVIARHSPNLPIIGLFEERQGHTFARNCAIDATDGELIIWTDDDCLFNEDWMTNYVEAANDTRFDFWGSAIEPVFQCDKPDWLVENWEICKGCFAERDLGNEQIELSHELLPYGANFAVRTELQKLFRFDETLGRKRNAVFGEDELEMMRRMLGDGHKGCWVPNNPVQHLISADRATTKYVYDYFVGQGNRLGLNNDIAASGTAIKHIEAFWNWLMFKIKRPFVPSKVWLSHMLRSALLNGERTVRK